MPLLACLFALVIATRAYLMYGSGSIPEINGGYALVQVRSIFETGWLGISDLPLTFYIHAGVAKVLTWFGTTDTDAIYATVRALDVVLPAFTVLGIGLTLLMLLKGREERCLLTTLGVSLATLSIVPLSMVGNYMKNSLGLVWMSFFFYFLFAWKHTPKKSNIIGLIIMTALLGVTHIGVLGISGFFIICMGVFFVFDAKIPKKYVVTGGLFGSLIFAIALAIVWQYDPTRVAKLAAFFTGSMSSFHGLSFLSSSESSGPGGGMMSLSNIPYLILGIIGLWTFWKAENLSERSIYLGISLGLILLGGPWISGDTGGRFGLILIIPASILLPMILTHTRRVILAQTLIGVLLVAIIASTTLSLISGTSPIVSTAAQTEMQVAKVRITEPEKSIIVTSHGTEWWTSWHIGTDIVQNQALDATVWDSYTHVYYLTTKQSGRMGGPGMGGMSSVLSWLGFGPPGMGSGQLMPPSGSQSGSMQLVPKAGGPFASMAIPAEANIIYSGSEIRIAEVTREQYLSSQSGSTTP